MPSPQRPSPTLRLVEFSLLSGLPPHGDLAQAFPSGWGRLGREGVVVRFVRSDGRSWVGNFAPGPGGLTDALPHPDHRNVLVFASGDLWVVDPETEAAELLFGGVETLWPVNDPDGLVMNLGGLAFARLGPEGIRWRTRRLSWDGFDAVRLDSAVLAGLAWSSIGDRWEPFEVDLASGHARGGTFGSDDAGVSEPREQGDPLLRYGHALNNVIHALSADQHDRAALVRAIRSEPVAEHLRPATDAFGVDPARLVAALDALFAAYRELPSPPGANSYTKYRHLPDPYPALQRGVMDQCYRVLYSRRHTMDEPLRSRLEELICGHPTPAPGMEDYMKRYERIMWSDFEREEPERAAQVRRLWRRPGRDR